MKGLLTILYTCIACISARSQHVYEISCRMPGNNITKGLLFRNTPTTGFIRLRNKAGTVSDFEWQSQGLFDSALFRTGKPYFYDPSSRDSFLCTKATYFRTIAGEPDVSIANFRIWFRKNKTTGSYEPYTGVLPFTIAKVEVIGMPETLAVQDDRGSEPNALVTIKKWEGKTFSKQLLTNFFAPAELTGTASFSVAQLNANRKKQRPVFYLITVNGDDKLCREDADKTVAYFAELTSFLGIGFRKKVIRDVEFNIAYVTKAIKGLVIGPNDIVLFTYSGHGFSFRDDDTHPFPQLALWHGDAPDKEFLHRNTVNIEEIYSMILDKKPRLAIVLSDCCNSYVEMKRKYVYPSLPAEPYPGIRTWNNITASHLFLDNRQSYLAAATEKGQVAGSHKWYGGFFTYSFLRAIESQLGAPEASNPAWKDLFQYIKSESYDRSKQYVCDGDVCGQRMISRIGK